MCGPGYVQALALMDAVTCTATILWAADAQHAQSRWHPIEHLAHALTDAMKLTAAAGTCRCVEIDTLINTRQVVWQCLASWLWRRGLRLRCGGRFASRGELRVNRSVLESESELILAQTFGACAVLHSLKLADDEFQTFDLIVSLRDIVGHIAHEVMQHRCIGRQIRQIKPHA